MGKNKGSEGRPVGGCDTLFSILWRLEKVDENVLFGKRIIL